MLPSPTVPELRPWEPLYDLVGTGMWAYTSTAFRTRFVGDRAWRMARGEMLVSTHRAETDVPLICGQVFFRGHLFASRSTRLSFAAREDMFDRGFFAGFPPGLSVRARRLLYRIDAGPYLPRVRVRPVPFPATNVLRVGRALAELPPGTFLADALAPSILESFAARAVETGLPAPALAGEVLRGEYADLLWTSHPRDILDAPVLEPVWRRRPERATEELRVLVEVVRAGESVLFFPEGRPSPDGSIGPLRPGLKLLVRRGSPGALRPIGLAYDRMTRGRPYAVFAMGRAIPPPTGAIEQTVLAHLRATTPLTCGQVVAVTLRTAAAAGSERIGTAELDDRWLAEIEQARETERPFERSLLDPSRRRRRLAAALAWALDRGLVRREGRRAVLLQRSAILGDGVLAYAAREHESARAPVTE